LEGRDIGRSHLGVSVNGHLGSPEKKGLRMEGLSRGSGRLGSITRRLGEGLRALACAKKKKSQTTTPTNPRAIGDALSQAVPDSSERDREGGEYKFGNVKV